MSHSLAIVGYVPPSTISPKICCPGAFVENIRQFRTAYPLILFSDGNWADTIRIPNPELAVNKEAKLKNGQTNTFALNNLIFFTALRIAHHRGFTHMIYLEADCRVGCHDWDAVLFDSHFKSPEPVVCSGSVVIFNPCNAGREAMNRWMDFITKTNTRRNYPCPTYGFGGQSLNVGSAVFVNGALGVYDLRWINSFFPEALQGPSTPILSEAVPVSDSDSWSQRLGRGGVTQGQGSVQAAEQTFAWDFAIGFELWKRFGVHAYDNVGHNPKVFSSFGDVISSEAERMEMLRNGEVVATHQIKSSAL